MYPPFSAVNELASGSNNIPVQPLPRVACATSRGRPRCHVGLARGGRLPWRGNTFPWRRSCCVVTSL